MIQDCNIPCKYSAHVLEFDDGTKLEGIDPGIRTPFGRPFVITSYSDEGPFTNPMLYDLLFDGEEPTQYGCQICGHYADQENIIKLFCNDINPLKGIDKRPEREVVTVESEVKPFKQFLNEAREKKTFDTFMTYLMNQDGRCSADGGDHTFYCLKLNDANFDFEGYDKFREQIEKEGLYDWSWVAGLIPNKNLRDGKVPVSWLPIFGDSNRYVTKWLQNGTPSSAVAEVFRDRRMKIKDRIDYFAIPAEEQLSLNTLKEELENIGLPCRIGNNRKGDFLETNLEFSQEACKRMHEIPVSSGYKIVWLIRNKFVINKHKFNSVQKVVDYFNENKELYELAEAREIIKKSGKNLIKESRDYSFEEMMKITEILYDSIEELNYDDARDIAEYLSEKMESLDVDREYVAETLEQMLDDCGIRISFDLATRLAGKIIAIY